jgi:hypothetical protein
MIAEAVQVEIVSVKGIEVFWDFHINIWAYL